MASPDTMPLVVADQLPTFRMNLCSELHGDTCQETAVLIELVRNLMAHAQKPHFLFRLYGRVHLNRRGSQFSRLLAAEVCASALVMLDTPRSEVVWEYWLPTPFASLPFTSPPLRHCVPPHSERSILPVCDVTHTDMEVWAVWRVSGSHPAGGKNGCVGVSVLSVIVRRLAVACRYCIRSLRINVNSEQSEEPRTEEKAVEFSNN